MQKNILWKGKAYHSLENCVVITTKDGTEVSSVIIGLYNNIIYKVEYFIKTNKNWETVLFKVKTNLNGITQFFSSKITDSDEALEEGNLAPFRTWKDIDISLTPFTNTLAINRLHLQQNEKRNIDVLYIDILNQQTLLATQSYTKLSKFEYKYEDALYDFEAIITVDEHGLVINYPELFERTAMHD